MSATSRPSAPLAADLGAGADAAGPTSAPVVPVSGRDSSPLRADGAAKPDVEFGVKDGNSATSAPDAPAG